MYLKNYNAFRGLLEKKDRNKRLIETLRKALYALEDHVFSEELKLLNRNSVLNNSNGKGFTKRWRFIEDIGKKHGIKCDDRYPNVNALIKAVETEKTIDYVATNVQRDEVLDTLTGRLKRDRLEELILKSLSFKLGKISKSQFYSYILLVAKSESLPRQDYDELEKFCDYVNLYESIDIGELMDEIDGYECRVKEKLFRNKDEEELTSLMKNMEILHNVFAVRLTSGQLRYFIAHMDDFRWGSFLDFIKAGYQKYGIPIPQDLAEVAELFDQMRQAMDFYEAATGRNMAMVENTIERMRENDVTVAAIVTGGFHTRGITDILRSDQLSYIILLPRFNPQTGKRPYITILTNKTNEYQHYTESGDYLAITSFFALSEKILEGMDVTEQEALSEKIRYTSALLFASFMLREEERGVLTPEMKRRMKKRFLKAYEAKQQELWDKGIITEEQKNSAVNALEGFLGKMHTTRGRNGETEIFFETDSGNFKYSVTFADAEKKGIKLSAWDSVPGTEMERVVFEGELLEAEIAGEEAIKKGRELLDRVSILRIQAISKRLKVMQGEEKLLQMTPEKLEEETRKAARKLGWRELTKEEIQTIKAEIEDIRVAKKETEAKTAAEKAAGEAKAREEIAEAERKAEETRQREEIAGRLETQADELEKGGEIQTEEERALLQAFRESTGTASDVQDGKFAGYDKTAADVVWHDFTHSGTNTSEAIEAMKNLRKRYPNIPVAALLLMAISGMYHDMGYYREDADGFGTIKVDHERRSMEFVLRHGERLGLKNASHRAIVCLIIAATEAAVGHKEWAELERYIEEGNMEKIKEKILQISRLDSFDKSLLKGIYEDG
ncbi:hypothetical protein ACFL5C_03485, partial [Candidatus Omnitrophota bacterium]